eukprot:13783_1
MFLGQCVWLGRKRKPKKGRVCVCLWWIREKGKKGRGGDDVLGGFLLCIFFFFFFSFGVARVEVVAHVKKGGESVERGCGRVCNSGVGCRTQVTRLMERAPLSWLPPPWPGQQVRLHRQRVSLQASRTRLPLV